jgi:hypothetical protein
MVRIPILKYLIYLTVSIKSPVAFILSLFGLVRLWMSCCLWFDGEEEWDMRVGDCMCIYYLK